MCLAPETSPEQRELTDVRVVDVVPLAVRDTEMGHRALEAALAGAIAERDGASGRPARFDRRA